MIVSQLILTLRLRSQSATPIGRCPHFITLSFLTLGMVKSLELYSWIPALPYALILHMLKAQVECL